MTNPAAVLIRTPLDGAYLSGPAIAAIIMLAVAIAILSAFIGDWRKP